MRLANLWGLITGKDAGEKFPKQQGNSLDRVGDFQSAQPYGIYANLPDGQLFKVIDEEGRVIMGVTVERKSGVEQGEVTIWHPGTGANIHFKNSGNLDIDTVGDTPGDININTVNANITASGDANINCVNSTVTATTLVTFDTPTGVFTGALNVTGLVTAAGYAFGGGAGNVAGAANFTGTIANNGTDIGENHGHTQANDSGGNTEANTGGVV